MLEPAKKIKFLVWAASILFILFMGFIPIAQALPPSVTLGTPNGGESWSGTQSIEWTATDAEQTGVDELSATLYTGPTDLGPWRKIASNMACTSGVQGSFSWNTPYTDNGSYYVKVEVSDGVGGSGEDVSDASFDVLNLIVVGDEQLVNVTTTDNQTGCDIDMNSSGNFVVIWHSGHVNGVFGRLYASDESPLTGELRLDTDGSTTLGLQSVAVDDAGNFVMARDYYNYADWTTDVYARRFDNSGNPLGSEFQVNTEMFNFQEEADVAMNAAGNFVVVWDSDGQTGDDEIFGQRYNSSGTPQGGEFQINTNTFFYQQYPAVAMNSSGSFVVAWENPNIDGSGAEVFARRYDSSGNPLGGEFQVNTYTVNDQGAASVAIDDFGNFVIVWHSRGQDGSDYGIYAQIYDSDGNPVGGEFQVNTYTTSYQYFPSVAMDSTGNFIVTWTSADNQDGSDLGIYAQKYDSAGNPVGGEFQVNTYTTGPQRWSEASMDAAGNFVISWESEGQDGSMAGIYFKRFYFESNAAPSVTVDSPNGGEAWDGTQVVKWTATDVEQTGTDELSATLYSGPTALGPWTIIVSNVLCTSGAQASYSWNTPYTENGSYYVKVEVSDGVGGNGKDVSDSSFTLYNVLDSSGDIHVNTYTANNQFDPAVAIDSSDNFVIAWESYTQDGDGYGIYAQRYDSSGNPQGSEFQVNTYTTGHQRYPAVAIGPSGNFVITWSSDGQDGDSWGVYAQRFDSSGNPQGSEFLVNTYTTSYQMYPAIAMDSSGNFVIAWHGGGHQDGNWTGIFAQRYDSNGNPVGSEFQVNTYTTNDQEFPSVTMDSTGNFVISWSSDGQDGGYYGIYAQRYDSSGNPQGSEFLVNTTTVLSQEYSSVAMDSSGNFVIAWQSDQQDGSDYGIYAQRYDSSGNPQGSEFRVNTYTANQQKFPKLSMDSKGYFIIVWQSYGQDGNFGGVYAQRYDNSGNPQADEFRINAWTTYDQDNPAVAMSSTGSFVVSWDSYFYGGEGSTSGIYMSKFTYQSNSKPSVIVDVPNGGETWSGTQDIFWTASDTEQIDPGALSATIYHGNSIIGPWTTIASGLTCTSGVQGSYSWDTNSVADNAYYIMVEVTDGIGDPGFDASDSTFSVYNNTDPSVTVDVPNGGENWSGIQSIQWTATDAEQTGAGELSATLYSGPTAIGSWTIIASGVSCTSGAQASYSWNTPYTANGSYYVKVEISDGAGGSADDVSDNSLTIENYMVNSGESLVNSYTTNNQSYPAVAMDSSGNFVIAWQSDAQDGDFYGIYAQRYDSNGNPLGVEFQVNTYTVNNQSYPSVGMNAAGDFVIAWQSYGQDGQYWGVYAQRYDSGGNPLGSEFLVNTYTTNYQAHPSVTMDNFGNFVIVWHSRGKDGSDYGIYAQRYDSSGNPLGSEFQVNTYTTNSQDDPSVAMNSSGNFVVVWQSDAQDGDFYGIYAQRYDNSGGPIGSEFQVNSYTTAYQMEPSVAMGSAGNFVVVWQSYEQDGSGYGVYAQRYDRNGNPQGNEFRVNTYTTNDQLYSSVAMDPLGNFVITWESSGQDGSSSAVYAQLYDSGGNPLGSEFLVNTYTTNSQDSPSVTMNSSGNFVVAWQSYGQDGSVEGIYMDLFKFQPTTNPLVTVDVPNGGEIWTETQNILWTATDAEQTGADELSATLYSGSSAQGTWTIIASGVSCTSGAQASYSWDTNPLPEGSYYVRVVVSDGAGGSGEDVSDNSFAVYDNTDPVATVNVPNGGEQWSTTHSIKWTVADAEQTGAGELSATLYSGPTALGSWTIIASDILCTSGVQASYSWDTGAVPDGNYYIRVVASDGSGGIGEDTSDMYFTIGSVAYWRFDENSGGTAYDENVNDNDGVIYGAAWVSGKHASALYYNGVENYVNVGDIETTAPATVACWVYANDISKDARLLSQLTGGISQAGSLRYDNGKLQVWNGSGWGTLISSGLAVNTWQHITVVYDGTDATAYLNGAAQGSYPSAFDFDGVDMGIGARFLNNSGRGFYGLIDEVIVFNRALGSVEVEELYLQYEAAITSITANDASNGGAGIQAGDQVTIVFNAETNAPTINASNIDSILELDNGHSWKDGSGNIGGAVWSGGANPKDTLTITLSVAVSAPSVNVNDTVALDGSVVKNKCDDPIVDSALISNNFGLDTQIPAEAATYWKFDETSGNTAYNEITITNDGTVYGAIWNSGVYGNSLDFNGDGDYIDMGAMALTDPATIAMWIYADSISGDIRLISQLSGGMGQAGALRYYKHKLQVCDGSAWGTIIDTGLETETWQHIAVVYDGINATAYLNGVAQSSYPAGFDFDGVAMGIGAKFLNKYGNTFSGSIDEMVVYGRALSADEVEELYLQYGAAISSIIANDASGGGTGIQSGDQVVILFNTTTNAPSITALNINSVLNLGAYSWLDGSNNIGGAVWSTTVNTDDTLTVTLSTSGGVPDISVGDTVTLDGSTIENKYNLPIMDSDVIDGNFGISVGIPAGAAVYWKFDEASGDTAYNEIDSFNDGVVYGAIRSGGKAANALDFDGINDHVNVGDVEIEAPATVAFWVYADRIAGDVRLFSQLTGAINQAGSLRYSGYRLEVWSGSSWGTLINTGLATGTWQHIAVVFDGVDATGYLNGVAQVSYSSDFNFSGVDLGIGAGFLYRYGYNFPGLLDEVVIYDRALTPAEVNDLYSQY